MSTARTHSSDILVIGGGLAGLATAIAAAQEGFSCRVLDKGTCEAASDTRYDGRASAISESSVRLLKSLGAWEGMREAANPIEDILVVDGFSDAKVHYDHSTMGDTPFGYIIPNANIRGALLQRAQALPNIHIDFQADIQSYHHDAHGVRVECADGTTHHAALMLACDGRFSKTRDWMGIDHRTVMYGQTAIVCTIAHAKPHHHVAVERFMPRGPFAILPMTENRSCIVWTEPDAMAKHMISLDEEAFLEELVLRSGDYLGEITLVSERFSYPLSLVQAQRYVGERSALVGDAAHGIHPIAGQGINLGYRDVAALRDVLLEAKRTGSDIGCAAVLEHYQQWRSFDAASMAVVMDGLVRLFSNDHAPVRIARRMGLRVVEKLTPTKQFFMMHAMGLLGDLPEFLQDKHAA
jgi:2-octaprenyl-6-methoxyphenol hydroxylase